MADEANRELLVSCRHIGVSYWLKAGVLRRKKYPVLQDVTFDIIRGDSLGVVGRNGCGKSTLLRLIAGIMTPDYGEMVWKPGIRSSLLTLQLGFVEYLTGRENAILSGMILGMRKREIEAQLDYIVEFAEIGAFIDEPLATYSSGMRARLGFAVAFQLDPDILLLDEVLGVGDAEFQAKSVETMKARIQSADSTVVFVSHSAPLVKSLCNRAIWIEEGVLKGYGNAAEVVDAYESAMADKQLKEVERSMQQGLPVFIRKKGHDTIYIIQEGVLEPIESWDAFVSLGGQADRIRVVTETQFNALQSGEVGSPAQRQVEEAAWRFVRKKGYPAVYMVRAGQLIEIRSWQEFADLGGRGDLVGELTEEDFEKLRLELSR